MKVTIVMPTYNEVENIEAMIDHVEIIRANNNLDLTLLVVDDNSPDGTNKIVRRKKMALSWLDIICGEKAGLGKAYQRGISKALNDGAEVIFEMDCDFSHNPDDIPRLLHELDNNFDFIIGSRYVTGGSVPKSWNPLRKINSSVGNAIARYVAGIYTIKDCTAGFRCIRSNVLKKINLNKINTQGYAFQVALLHAAYISGAKIKEIPVEFIDRTRGQSKLGWYDIAEFGIRASSIRLTSMSTFLRFCTVGASGVVINLGILSLCLKLSINLYLSSLVAIGGSIIWNFLSNSHWTFSKIKKTDGVNLQGLYFNMISLLSLISSFMVFVVSHISIKNLSPYSAQIIAIIPATLINYFLNSYWKLPQQQHQN